LLKGSFIIKLLGLKGGWLSFHSILENNFENLFIFIFNKIDLLEKKIIIFVRALDNLNKFIKLKQISLCK
jgi:hypothetical protein